MKIVYKYPLERERNVFNLPKGAKILKVGQSSNSLCIWVLHDTNEAEKIDIILRIYYTGRTIPSELGLEYLDTVSIVHKYSTGKRATVYHVFQESSPKHVSTPYTAAATQVSIDDADEIVEEAEEIL